MYDNLVVFVFVVVFATQFFFGSDIKTNHKIYLILP